MDVLVLNAGSSSLKYQLIRTGTHEEVLVKGQVERIGEPGGEAHNHAEAVERALAGLSGIEAVGHRVVHGGVRFSGSVRITGEVERVIEECSALAPLHNPHNLAAYRASRRLLENLPHVAVFDTSFFHTLPARAYLYALPWEYYERDHIRRYGFHGTSHRYLAARAGALLGGAGKLITCHLGNGCSVCAVDGGRAVDVSLGFTPLEGLVMGSRSGDIDPGILFHLGRTRGLDLAALERLLNRESGLKGLSGRSNDMRDLEEAAVAGDARAELAIEVFCYRLVRYIGAFWAVLGGADGLVFSAGIGENRTGVRTRVCRGLECFGVRLDEEANRTTVRREGRISADGALPVWVIPTNEEVMIARDTAAVVRA
jgi:acetate kinase